MLISPFFFTHGSLREGENMQLNEDTRESNLHSELKIIYIKEEEPNNDEYLCESSLCLNNTLHDSAPCFSPNLLSFLSLLWFVQHFSPDGIQ